MPACLGLAGPNECFVNTRRVCGPCLIATRAQKRRRWIFRIGALGVVALVALAIVITKPSCLASSGHYQISPRHSEPELMVLLRQRVAEHCDNKDALTKLTDMLIRNARYAETISTVMGYESRCGNDVLLKKKTFYSFKRLRAASAALSVSSEIIAEDPFDADYWRWRGEVQSTLGRDVEAVADYRQSVALGQGWGAGRNAVVRLVEAASNTSRPCDSVFSFAYLEHHRGAYFGAESQAIVRTVERKHSCQALASGTEGLVPSATSTQSQEVTVIVGGEAATFLVETTAGTTVVSGDLAKKLGLAADGGAIEAVATGRIRRGERATVDLIALDGIEAKKLEVLIATDLDAGVDGVLGLNFIWRFKSEPGTSHLILRGP